MDVEELKRLLLKKFPDMEMTNQRQTLSFTTAKTKDKEVLSWELLFCWPYFWIEDPELLRPLARRLSNDIKEKVHRRNKHIHLPMFTREGNLFILLSAPRAWIEDALTSASSPGYTKLVIWSTYIVVTFLIDDVAESWRREKEHARFVRTLARLTYNMSLLRFESLEEVQEDLDYQYLVGAEGSFETFLPLLFDWHKDLKTFLEVTPRLFDPSRTVLVGTRDASTKEDQECVKTVREETMKYLARAGRYLMELQTWMDCSDYTQVLKQDVQVELRSWVIGLDVSFETLFLLDGVIVPEKVRRNFYWDRCLRMYRKLIMLNNDIFSLRKEWAEQSRTEKRLDNTILIAMELENLDAQGAMTKCAKAHNELLNDYRKECKFALENDQIKFELCEEEKIIFDFSLKSIARIFGPAIQEQLLMVRYGNDDLDLTFNDLPPFDY